MALMDFNLDDIGGVFTSIREAITGKKVIDPIELAKVETVLDQLENTLMTGQMEVNKVEAASGNIFVAGWRPAIGWIGAVSLGYQFVIYPFAKWISDIMQVAGPPVFESDLLYVIITGMLGIGGMRSFDKMKKTDTRRVA